MFHCFKETSIMKKRCTGTQIVVKLRQADRLLGQGKTVPEVCREIEVSQQTYYRWRQKYGGMSPEMVKELRGLQKENSRLRKVVADQALDNAILKEAAAKNF
jgi:putative transposase